MLLSCALWLAVCVSPAPAQPCVGDCNGDHRVTIDELIKGVNIALGSLPLDNCLAFDANHDGQLLVNELIEAVNRLLYGCPPEFTPMNTPTRMLGTTPTETRTFAPTARPTNTPEATFTAPPTTTPPDTPTITPNGTAPATPAMLSLRVRNDSGADQMVRFSGERISGPPPGDGALAYGPTTLPIVAGEAGASQVPVATALAPGVWLHHAEVLSPGPSYAQHQQSLVIADPDAPNLVDWRLFRTVLTVNQKDDFGDGVCDATCTLRDALASATSSSPPILVRFDHVALADEHGRAEIEITRNDPLRVQVAGTVIDGRDAAGNPSPLADFAERVYPLTITLVAENANPDGSQACPCNASPGGALRVQAEDVRIESVAIQRRLAAEGTICCGDQDLVGFDPGSNNSRITTCMLDGGARAISSAEVEQGETGPPSGKDCVDAEDTGATADEPVVIENSELRFCYDRGVKSQHGYARLEGNWIHHNLRGGLFAQSPTEPGAKTGVVDAIANLVEHNGRNCPSGDPRDCGADQRVTRTDASELSAQGALTELLTDGNVLRNGVSQGIFLQDDSGGAIVGDYVCGSDDGNGGGVGILVKANEVGPQPLVSVRGSSAVYNSDSGVKLQGSQAADFGADGAIHAGRNAFAANGSRLKRNFVNALDVPDAIIAAQGNQWEHCYPSSGATPDRCDPISISQNDTNNDNQSPTPDRVDNGNPLPHQSSGPVQIDSVAPLRAVQGGLVRITGAGFDAISGHVDAGRDCTALKTANTCAPLRGTCVEFLVGTQWVEAQDIVAVTPTHLVVRAPSTCTSPVLVRVRRPVFGGGEAISEPAPFCRN